MDPVFFIINAFLFILPAYIANSTAMLFGGGKPVDFGKHHSDGRRVFGDGKTWIGLTAGIFFGSLAGYLEGVFLQQTPWAIGGVALYGMLGITLAAGAVFGDLVAAYGKRRAGLERGQPAFLIDQLDFVCGAMLLSLPLRIPGAETLVFILIATPSIHFALNWVSHRLHVKQVPW
jgi:CDP-2,3-bis-(O-geranylgeranyl)-sn-glycerol synthase